MFKLAALSLVLFVVIVSPVSSAQREIDVEALLKEAQKWGVECQTERRAQLLICEQDIENAKQKRKYKN